MSLSFFFKCCFSTNKNEKDNKTEIQVEKELDLSIDGQEESFMVSGMDAPIEDQPGKMTPQGEEKKVRTVEKDKDNILLIDNKLESLSQPNESPEYKNPNDKHLKDSNVTRKPPIQNEIVESYNKNPKEGSSARESNFTLGKEEENKGEHISISKQTIESANKLTLEIKDGSALEIGSKIQINAGGYPRSQRAATDGYTYFGTAPPQFGEVTNDFLVPKEETGFGKKHFVINYNPKNGNYYIQDLNDGTGTFVKISDPLTLQHCFIISFGDSHMVTHFMDSQSKIILKFLEGPKQNTTYSFNTADSPITIGRGEKCTIRFKNNTLSRNQCTINYTGSEWRVADGNGVKTSTNGTWLFVDSPYMIQDGLIFKAGATLFTADIHK